MRAGSEAGNVPALSDTATRKSVSTSSGRDRLCFWGGQGFSRAPRPPRVPLHSSSYKKIEIDKTDEAREGQGEEHGWKAGQAEDDAHDHRSEPKP